MFSILLIAINFKERSIIIFLCSADILSALFSDSILSNPMLKFLLTHKYLFVRTYMNVSQLKF